MKRRVIGTLATCLFSVGTLVLGGCKSSRTAASSSGYALETVEASSSTELSGPPTMNPAYAARNPRHCGKLTTPPTAAQAAALVQCSYESDRTGTATPELVLTTDVEVELGSPRAEIAGLDDVTDIDVTAKVYPIRGGGTSWWCSPVAEQPAGRNCLSYPRRGSSTVGRCYKTNFGEYQCLMSVGGSVQVQNLPGPTTY